MKTKHLAMHLSSLEQHPQLSVALEQYQTEGALAARWLTVIEQQYQIDDVIVADLGCGNGILGIGCLLLGAEHVTFIESDVNAIEILHNNLKDIPSERYTIVHQSIDEGTVLPSNIQMVIMNPPWGVQKSMADRAFFNTALSCMASSVHVLHSSEAQHIQTLAQDMGWSCQKLFNDQFRLPAIYQHHQSRQQSTSISCWALTR
ncbi:MAG: methyltransferase [archaeon]|nr:methyltransferase [archaeon]MDA1168110.1 methyltransferase [archaeon]